VIRRRGEFSKGPGRPGPFGLKREDDFDQQDPAHEEDNQRDSPGKDVVPQGLLRFKANARLWRARLERELRVSPPTAADRERILRWVNSLRGREAWLEARLEHAAATKRLLVEVLDRKKATGE
jgi:hypothetical protein